MSPSLKVPMQSAEQSSTETLKTDAIKAEEVIKVTDTEANADVTEVTEQEIAVAALDFTYIHLRTTSFCMRCGAPASYQGRSKAQNFSKRLCADCVQYYLIELNGGN